MSTFATESKTTLVGTETDASSIRKTAEEEDRDAPALDLDKEVRISLDALASLPQPIGLDPSRCLTKPTLLSINKAPCWKVSEFSVKDVETGQPVFECKGKFNVWAEKDIYNAEGKHLFHMSTKFWSLSRKTTVTHPDGSEAFVVAAECWSMKPQLRATFTDKLSGKPVEIYLDGTYKRGKGRILMDGQEIAQLYREKLLKDERRVVIAPNADTALIFTVVLVFDMILYELVASSSILAPVVWATSY